MGLQGIDKGNYIAINQAFLANNEGTFDKVFGIAPKVCVTTASSPDFLGFHALVQTGAHNMGGRFGAAKMINAESPQAIKESLNNLDQNPIHLWQYTVWTSAEAHEKMHYDNFDRMFEFCTACLTEIVEGPYEPVYKVLEADMPNLMDFTDVPKELGEAMMEQQPIPKVRLTDNRTVVVGIHKIKEGHEEDFVKGATEVMQMLNGNVPGMIGWMIMEKVGESAYGPMQLAPEQF